MLELLQKITKLNFAQNRAEFIDLYNKIKVKEVENPQELEKLGWVESFISNSFFIKAECQPIYSTFNQFKTKKPTGYAGNEEIENHIEAGALFKDEVNNGYFLTYTEKRAAVLMRPEDDALVTTCSSSLNSDRIFSAPVSRGTKILSLFNTHFVDHTGAQKKQFAVPTDEAFGIEIEMKFPTVFSKLRFSHYVGTNFKNWITERDGSLEDFGNAGDGGLELVSPPLPFNTLAAQLKTILAEARKQKGLGHGAGVYYGIHINVNIYGDDKESTARRFICLINDPNLRYFWETMSRRRGSASMQKYCAFKNVAYDSCLRSEADGHYRATYYRTDRNGYPTNCVEVRIFRSNLKFPSVKISIEITKLALDFAMNKANVLDDYAGFRDYINTNASEELKRYILASDAISCLDRAANLFSTKKSNANLAEFAE